MKRHPINPLLLFLAMALTSCSANTPVGSLVDGHLRPCPDRPNCLNSEQNGAHYTEPIVLKGNIEDTWQKLEEIIGEMGGEIQSRTKDYLWATFTSRIFRFVDDLELRLEAEHGIIHIRSGSRVGYSDLGVNAKRVAELRSRFSQKKELSPQNKPNQ